MKRSHLALYRTFIAVLSAVATVALVAGCAELGATSSASAPTGAVSAPPSELIGTWRGDFGWVGAFFYEDEATVVLRINEDGTFTATIARGTGTNNLAKPATLSGTVVTHGNRVTLRNTHGPWAWVTLVHSGDTLYGLAIDPAIETTVMIKLEHEGGLNAGASHRASQGR